VPNRFPAVLTSLWLRLSTVFIVGLLFLFTLQVPGIVSGWTFYLKTPEIGFELVVFVVFMALAGVTLGALCAVAVGPFLFYQKSSRRRFADNVTKTAVAVVAFIDLGTALMLLTTWAGLWGTRRIAVLSFYCAAFVVALCVPRRREQLVTSLDGFLGEKATRRTVIATGIASAALIATEAVMGRVASAAVPQKRASRPSGPNILMITFDALSAEDMSLYGYRLPTTPQIDEFARKSSVFTNFYSASTFTTPSVATLLSGLHPSEHHVYHLEGRFRGPDALRTFPRLMRAGGYTTGASITNPFANFLFQSIAADFDYLPPPAYRAPSLWDATRILHQRQPFGSRVTEFDYLEIACNLAPQRLEAFSPRRFGNTTSGFPPAGSFQQARQVLEQMPDGFFLWVHLFAPHAPYLPSAANLRRFLSSDEMRTAEEQYIRFFPSQHYPQSEQPLIDKARLRYDEFLADADCAFGAFLSWLEGAGRLRNTAVIVGADHGESFEGGIYAHESVYQTRPEIHVPLIIRMPGQERGSRVAFACDQTALAPTVLEIAGLPRPDWMRGESLLPWLNRTGEGEGQGLAFTQYLERNSTFRPLHNGTVGVIDGRHQYVLDLSTGKGIFRGLAEAHDWNLDRSAENPAMVRTLRDAIYSRFPDLPRNSA
jgi:arylsulfatase A-like enzyme